MTQEPLIFLCGEDEEREAAEPLSGQGVGEGAVIPWDSWGGRGAAGSGLEKQHQAV